MSIETAHSSAHANQSMAKSSKRMIEVALKGTTGQIRTNRQVAQPIWKMSSNTHKIPETTAKQPLKESELKCYECGQKGHMRPQCPKLRSRCIAAVTEDDLEEIAENIEGNLKEDVKSSTSKEEEIPQEEEDNLNESSGEDCYKVDCLAFFLIFFLIFLIHPEPFYPFATYLSHLRHHRNRIPFYSNVP